MRGPVASHDRATLCLPVCLWLLRGCLHPGCAPELGSVRVRLFMVMCVPVCLGLFLLVSPGLTRPVSVPSPGTSLAGLGGCTPGRGVSGQEALEPREAAACAPGPGPPVPGQLTWCKPSPWNAGRAEGARQLGCGGGRGLPDSKNNLPHWAAAPNIFYGLPAPWPDASACSSAWPRPPCPPTCFPSLEMGASAPCDHCCQKVLLF